MEPRKKQSSRATTESSTPGTPAARPAHEGGGSRHPSPWPAANAAKRARAGFRARGPQGSTRTSGIQWPQVPIEECGNPGSGVACRLFVVAHPGQRPAEQADDREHAGQGRILTRRACERGQLAGMVVHEGVADARVDLHVIVDAVAVQDSLQPGWRVSHRPVAGTVAGHDRAGVLEQVLGICGQRPIVDTRGFEPMPGRQGNSESAAHAKTDHSDVPGAAGLAREPGPGGVDVIEGRTPAPGDVPDGGDDTPQLAAPGVKIGCHREIPRTCQPFRLRAQIRRHADGVMNDHNTRPGPRARGCRQVAAQSSRGWDLDLAHGCPPGSLPGGTLNPPACSPARPRQGSWVKQVSPGPSAPATGRYRAWPAPRTGALI